MKMSFRPLAAFILLMSWALPAHAAGENPFSPAYPDPERFSGDIAAFEAVDAEAPPPPSATLCIGSSSMRMWHATIARDLEPLTVIPRGFGGSTMFDVIHFAPRIVFPYRPGTILLYEGDNDIDFGVSPGEFMEAFRAFVSLVHLELPATRIFVISIKPSGARWARWPAMQNANGMLRRDCAGDSSLTFIDVATPLLGDDGLPREDLYLPDRLHLAPGGYEIWSEAIAEVLLGGK